MNEDGTNLGISKSGQLILKKSRRPI